jgi:23S rRNA (cytidine1920-2'-O)/16S rRNA (cytidine1409-2'-O)-methyltransferase
MTGPGPSRTGTTAGTATARRAGRLDVVLVDAGLQSSRTRAAKAVAAGRVSVNGRPAAKASEAVAQGAELEVAADAADRWVGRAAHKLLGALETFPIPVAGRSALDAGASTGGFTQVLLEAGAASVLAVDVGHGQLHPSLVADARVENREGVNLRHLRADDVPGGVDLIVGDLSFISLRLLVGPLASVLRPDGDALLMVKPQFEVGRARLARTGVVTDPDARREAVAAVVDAAEAVGLVTRGVGRSRLAGQDGNAEFFLHLVRASRADGAPERESLLGAVDYG